MIIQQMLGGFVLIATERKIMNAEEIASIEEYTSFTKSDKAFKLAAERGQRVVLPDEYTLQLDVDNEETYKMLNKRLELLRHLHYYPSIIKDVVSKSGLPHRHIYIKVSKILTQTERIVIQQYLGSDPIRELLSYVRVTLNDPYPTLLFEPLESESEL